MVNYQLRKNQQVMKPTTKPRIGQERRQRPKLCKWTTNKDLRLASWNVLTLLRTGGLRLLTDALKTAKIDIAAVQETRWPGTNLLTSREYKFYYSGKTDGPREFGTGFVVLGEARHAVIGFGPIDERLCTLRIRGKFFNITLINAHAPTEDKDDDVKDAFFFNVSLLSLQYSVCEVQFYEKLQAVYNQAPERDVKILLGDFNAKVGREMIYRPTIGMHSLHETSNENGSNLIDFAVSNNMVISSTYFPHKNIHKATWRSPDGKTVNQIDHVLIDGRHRSNILDVRSCRGPNIDSDHYMVRTLYRFRIEVRKPREQSHRRFDVDKLRDPVVRQRYVENLEDRIVADEAGLQYTSASDTWERIKRNVGWKTGNNRNDWYDDECKLATQAKNEARAKRLQRETRANSEDYRAKRNIERKLLRKKKVMKEQEIFREINQMSNERNKQKLYLRIKQMRNGYNQQPLLCKDVSGVVMADEVKCIERWTEYFRGLLNQSSSGTGEVEEPIHVQQLPTQNIEEPTLEEVRRTVLKLKNKKAPGTDNLPGELFKCGGETVIVSLHELMVQVWRAETIPDEWMLGIICPLFKKGDKLDCGNYRGITLLNTAYKIFAEILFQRLLPYAEGNIGEYQCGFRNGRSTTDQLFGIRQILEKCREFNIETHHLFIDFKAAYDKIIRKELWKIMAEFGFPEKLISLTMLTLTNVKSQVRIRNLLSDFFDIMDGLRQGDPLSTLLLNVALEKAVRSCTVDTSNTIYRKSSQLLGFADDIDLAGRSVDVVKDEFTKLSRAAAHIGLEVSESKTKYMATSSSNSRQPGQTLQIDGRNFETVDSFVYLGSQVNSDNNIGDEIRRRVTLGNRCYYSLKKLFRSKTLHRSLKCELYRSLVRPVVAYGSESWCMTQRDEQVLKVFERKILRSIFGAINDGNIWRRRFNYELYELYDETDIVRTIKISRLRWLGHVQRMDEDRIPRKLLNTHPDGKRRAGRPRGRWKDAVELDLRNIGVNDWRSLAGNRSDWRSLLEEAKTDRRL